MGRTLRATMYRTAHAVARTDNNKMGQFRKKRKNVFQAETNIQFSPRIYIYIYYDGTEMEICNFFFTTFKR